jgi:hypothetical protein
VGLSRSRHARVHCNFGHHWALECAFLEVLVFSFDFLQKRAKNDCFWGPVPGGESQSRPYIRTPRSNGGGGEFSVFKTGFLNSRCCGISRKSNPSCS